MTDEQFTQLIAYLDAINQLTIKQYNMMMFSAIVLALAGGLFIGYKWGHK